MTSPLNWPTFPPLKMIVLPKRWLTCRHPSATCHIVCEPPSLPPPKRSPPPLRPTPRLSPQAPAHTHAAHPAFIAPGSGPSRKGKERA